MSVVMDASEIGWQHLDTQAACFLISSDAHVTQRYICSMEVLGATWKSTET